MVRNKIVRIVKEFAICIGRFIFFLVKLRRVLSGWIVILYQTMVVSRTFVRGTASRNDEDNRTDDERHGTNV